MERFIRNQSIERYRRLLAQNPGEAEREMLERLLAEEEAKAQKESREEA